MRLPTLRDLAREQNAIYNHAPDEHLFVAGPPGSGKTSLAVLRAKFLRNLERDVIVVTKNRMLAALAMQLDGTVLVAMTMHSFVFEACWRDLKQGAPTLDGDSWDIDWDRLIAMYQSVDSSPTLHHLIIDEGQNLPSGFFRWALRYGATTITVFADEDQTTNSQRATLQDIYNAGMPHAHRLRLNHRNTAEIAAVAEHFHGAGVLPPAVVERRGRQGEIPSLVRIATWDQLARLIAMRFENRGGAIGVILRRRDEVIHMRQMIATLLPEKARVDAYVSNGDSSPEGISLLEPGITVLTSESVIGLEFDTVYLQDLDRSLPCHEPEQARRMYMLCARARDSLILIDGPTALTPYQISALPPPDLLAR